MSVSNRNSGIHVGVMQAHEKYAMKIKETTMYNFFDDRKDFV